MFFSTKLITELNFVTLLIRTAILLDIEITIHCDMVFLKLVKMTAQFIGRNIETVIYMRIYSSGNIFTENTL